MEFPRQEHFTRASDGIVGTSFNIQMTDKMFETLYANLYTNKPLAVVRELVCNALDTHNMRERLQRMVVGHYNALTPFPSTHPNPWLADRNTPFEVHLPSDLESYFEVKDFGIGLSLEKIIGEPIVARENEVMLKGGITLLENVAEDDVVMGVPKPYNDQLVFRDPNNNEILRNPGLYTTLFHSTKETDNDQIGAFGLGSKSPFSLSDSFTVESRYNGVQHNFLMFLNANRIPVVDVMTKDYETRDPRGIPTEEKNGLTVRIPIKVAHYHKMAVALRDLCRTFEPSNLPVVTGIGYDDFKFNFIDRSRKDGQTFIQQPNRYGTNTHYAVMGNVAYPIDLDQINPRLKDVMSHLPSTYTWYDLGQLNIPPSRETLTYDDISVLNLEQNLSTIYETFFTAELKKIEDAASKGILFGIYAWKAASQIYGDEFGKRLRGSLKDDDRFGEKAQRVIVPELALTRDNGMTRAAVKIKPFTIEQYSAGNRDKTEMNYFSVDELNRVEFVILNETHAFVQKINQLKYEKGRSVVLIIPRSYDNMFDLKKGEDGKWTCKDYSEEDVARLVAYREEWFGDDPKKVNFLAFGDKFLDHYNGIISDVHLMSELTYQKLHVNENPGILEFDGYRNHHNETAPEVEDITTRAIEVLSEKGLIPFMEMSGLHIIHNYKGRQIKVRDVNALKGLLSKAPPASDNGHRVSLSDSMGLATNVPHFGRRKAAKFVKENPSFFIDCNDIIDLLSEQIDKHAEAIQRLYDHSTRNDGYNPLVVAGRALWVAQQLDNDELYATAKSAFVKMQPVMTRIKRNTREQNRLQRFIQCNELTPEGQAAKYQMQTETFWYKVREALMNCECWAGALKTKIKKAGDSLRDNSVMVALKDALCDIDSGLYNATRYNTSGELLRLLEKQQMLKLIADFKPQYFRYTRSDGQLKKQKPEAVQLEKYRQMLIQKFKEA